MTADLAPALREHLRGCHPGARAPWFTGSSWIEQMSTDQLGRLHDELHRQGEDDERQPRVIDVRRAVCRRTGCAVDAVREDGLCVHHGTRQDQLRGRRSA